MNSDVGELERGYLQSRLSWCKFQVAIVIRLHDIADLDYLESLFLLWDGLVDFLHTGVLACRYPTNRREELAMGSEVVFSMARASAVLLEQAFLIAGPRLFRCAEPAAWSSFDRPSSGDRRPSDRSNT